MGNFIEGLLRTVIRQDVTVKSEFDQGLSLQLAEETIRRIATKTLAEGASVSTDALWRLRAALADAAQYLDFAVNTRLPMPDGSGPAAQRVLRFAVKHLGLEGGTGADGAADCPVPELRSMVERIVAYYATTGSELRKIHGNVSLALWRIGFLLKRASAAIWQSMLEEMPPEAPEGESDEEAQEELVRAADPAAAAEYHSELTRFAGVLRRLQLNCPRERMPLTRPTPSALFASS